LIASSFLAVSAFGVDPSVAKVPKVTQPTGAFRKDSSVSSPLFRDPTVVRGGAVPGWAAYNDALDSKPLFTKAMTSLVGWGLGDVLAQIFISGGPFDWKRFVTLSVFGFIYHGPSGHYFYNWLDGKIKGTRAQDVALKVGIDQILWCPIFMTVFFTYLGLCNGDSFNTIGNKIKNDLLSACQGSWKVWPIVHAVNFKFISSKHRLVFINAVQVAFNMFLSLIGTK
jgi:protein Mpv17